MKTEIWKYIPGCAGKYQVSNLGNVKSNIIHNGTSTRILSPENVKGYHRVVLCVNGEFHKKTVHRLVAESFIPNELDKPQVNHKNGIKNDNRIENLEWCTASENTKHKFDVLGHKGTCFGKKGLWNYLAKKVDQFSKEGKFIERFDSHVLCSQKLRIPAQNIGRCVNGKGRTAGGFIFKGV